MKTIVRTVYCEYTRRMVPVFYTFSGEQLISVECPHPGCPHSRRCPAIQSPPASGT